MRRSTVQEWHADQGWGVVAGDDLPSPCFVHFSVIDAPGFRELRVGDVVLVDYEETIATQDGYRLRATAVQPVESARTDEKQRDDDADTSGAYSSSLTIEFDDPDAVKGSS